MGWKNRISRFNGKMTKEKWLLLLLIGVLLMILSFPLPGGSKKDKNAGGQIAGAGTEGAGAVPLWTKDNTNGSGEDSGFGQGSSQNGMAQGPDGNGAGASDGREDSYPAAARTSEDGSYEAQMENRIRNILKSVDGVGKVDVMVVLKSSSEKVLRVDRSTNTSTTQEKDSGGGTRDVTNNQIQENTILAGSGSGSSTNAPIVEKELSPEISGIIISAEGGGSPTVKAEISEAMEALFGLPANKIKVLKRVE